MMDSFDINISKCMGNILEYDLGLDVTAFTAGCDATLPYEVTVGHQVHGDRIGIVGRPGMTRAELDGCDALITQIEGCAIGVRTADCIPILLHDPVRRVVASVHSGWKGTVLRISQKVIGEMTELYGTSPSDLRAVIGPGICRECFQVGSEVVQKFRDAGFDMETILTATGPRIEGDLSTGDHIDLFEANRWLLEESGISRDAILLSGICTYEDGEFYSARRQGSACGRNINAIMLVPRK